MALSGGDGSSTRRGALRQLVAVGSGAFALGTVGPAARVLLAPAIDSATGEQRWYRVARLADVTDGVPKRVAVIADVSDAWTRSPHENLGAVWLLRDKDEVRALSVTCPHLGCGIEFAPASRVFGCPCHASEFEIDGKRKAGPSPRDMDTLEARLTGDGADRVVEVRYKKFRQGLAEREEVG